MAVFEISVYIYTHNKNTKVILSYLQKKQLKQKGKKLLANKQKPNKRMSENPLFIYK